MITVLIRRHEVIPKCGSFGVRYSDGRPSQYFYWEDLPGRSGPTWSPVTLPWSRRWRGLGARSFSPDILYTF